MLFELPPKNEKKVSAGNALITGAKNVFPCSYKLADTISLLDEGKSVHWLSDGDWSMHDMLLALLQKSGPADVYLSSYSFSEYPARLIAEQISQGIIRSLYCLIDKRLDVRSASALTIIKNMSTRLELVNTHAKVTVIENDKMMIVVNGSANYTTNKRYESGIVVMDRETANFHKKWMMNEFNRSKS